MDLGYDDTLHDTLADLPTCAPAIFFDTDTTGATGTETNHALLYRYSSKRYLCNTRNL